MEQKSRKTELIGSRQSSGARHSEEGKCEGPLDLKERTKRFAVDIVRFAALLPKSREADIIVRQLVKAGTSVGANYREANRARSKAEFVAKIGIVEQEADESLFWLEIIDQVELAKGDLLNYLLKEADELVAIFATIGKRSKA